MTYSQPQGYRIPSAVSLPLLSRRLEQLGWPTWRSEVISTLAMVCHELVTADDPDEVFARLSHDQLSSADLPLGGGLEGSLVGLAAEFLDVAHGLMSMPSARPLSPTIDLRCRAQFMDDPLDPGGWTYVLFGTQRAVLESAFLDMNGVEAYPIDSPGADPEGVERAAVWDRVLAPYARFTPLSVSAPEPQVLFDILESQAAGPEAEEALAAQGKVTMGAVVDAYLRFDDSTRDEVAARLLAPGQR